LALAFRKSVFHLVSLFFSQQLRSRRRLGVDESALGRWQSAARVAVVLQTPTCSANASASSIEHYEPEKRLDPRGCEWRGTAGRRSHPQ
jgi:hypothetical protein